MTIGIRTKLIALLTLVALLPLVACLLVIVVGGRSLRRDTFAQGMLAVALSEGSVLRVSLGMDIEKIDIAMQSPSVLDMLSARDKPMPFEQVELIDSSWPGLDESDPRVQAVLKNPIADLLQVIRVENLRLAELLVADRFGYLVAATGKTSDFYQADEKWWFSTHAKGRLRGLVAPVSFDESAGVWSVYVSIPIRKDGKFVGVVKAVLDVSRWIGEGTRTVRDLDASVMLIRGDGKIIYGPDVKPMERKISQFEGRIVNPSGKGWRVTSDGRIQAFVPVVLPPTIGGLEIHTPFWKLIVEIPESKAMAGVYKLSMWVLLVGLCLIGLIFLVGLVLVERSIIRRIRLMEIATHNVAHGDLSHRIDVGWAGKRLLGEDEIDDLASDFNRMVEQVQHSHLELQDANALRTTFIRIAGHELRTPVSFILATARLLKENCDPGRLAKAVRAMGEKAERLNEIIQAMFKLMPERGSAESLQYEDVDMTELLEEVYTDCKPFVDERGQRLIIDSGEERIMMRGDRAKLADIIENLMMNAIKFTPDGGRIDIGISRELGEYVAVSVRDQGPGIPPEDQARIFEPFYGGGDVMKHSTGRVGYLKRGAGLGLTIVRYFAQLHGGTVRLSSGPDGSTFTVTLPLSPQPQQEHQGRHEAAPGPHEAEHAGPEDG